MGIFQQQFNSLLSNAVRADIGTKVVSNLPSEQKKLKANDFETIAADLEKNPEVQDIHAALDRLGAQALQDKVMKEEIMGQQVEQSKLKVINNRAKAKGFALTDKQFAKEFNKRAKPIIHGGNE